MTNSTKAHSNETSLHLLLMSPHDRNMRHFPNRLLVFGVSGLFFDAFNHEILQGFIPAQYGIHAGFGKILRPETTKGIR